VYTILILFWSNYYLDKEVGDSCGLGWGEFGLYLALKVLCRD